MKRLLVVAAVLSLAAPAHAGVVDGLVKRVFQKRAQKTGERVFHAKGFAYHGTFTGADGKAQPAVIRVSRGGAGKPGKADILGVAVKYEGASGPQDLLMVTAKSDRGWKARVPRMADTLAGERISSLLSFQANGQKGALTAELPGSFTTLADRVPGGSDGRQRFGVNLVRGGFLFREQVVVPHGTVEVDFDRPVSVEGQAQLRYTPFNTGAGVTPAGWFLNRLRKPAYAGSQQGRGLASE